MKPASQNKPAFTCDDSTDELRVSWRTGSNAIGGFLLFWLAGWSVGCALMTNVVLNDMQFRNLAGATVVWLGWFVGAIVMLQQFFGRERILFAADGITLWQGVFLRRGPPLPLDEIIEFAAATEETSSDDGPRITKKLEIRTAGRPVRIGTGLPPGDIGRLAKLLRDRLTKLRAESRREAKYPNPQDLLVFQTRSMESSLPDEAAVRSISARPLEPPSDTRIRRTDEFDAVRFVSRGQFSLGAILGVLFLNLFWSGIVSIFVYNLWWGDDIDKPAGLDWFWTFLFLIPFELVGLAMLIGLLFVVLDPVRTWNRRFATTEIVDRLAWFGLIGLTSRYTVGTLVRLDVRRVPYQVPKFPKRLPLASLWAPEGCPTYSLVPVDAQGNDVCQIEGLTWGEACWMADTLLHTRGEWFA